MANELKDESSAAAPPPPPQPSELIHAAANGLTERAKELIASGADVNGVDEHHNSALHEAAWNGYSLTIELLCKHKANFYNKNKQGHSALHLACQQGHNQSCRILLLNGCKPDIKNNFGDTPLHSAARYGHAGVVRILLSAFCNVNEVNKNGDTALHISAAMGRKKLTRILLETGSNPTIQNKQGETPMSICIRKSYTDVQEIIANPPPVKLPTTPNGSKSGSKKELPTKSAAKREKESSQGSKDSGELRRQERFKKTRSGSSRSVHFTTDGVKTTPTTATTNAKNKDKKTTSATKLVGQSCEWSPYGCHMHPDVNDFPKPKLNTLPADPLSKGEQYFLDLAGNIRKGPVAKSNKCYCRPLISDMEKRMEKDKQELIQHIDYAHEDLTEKICSLEKKTETQLVSLNEAVHQKLSNEKHECTERLHRTALRERIDSQRFQRLQMEQLKGEVKTWLASKLDHHRRSFSEHLDRYREVENSQNRHPMNSGGGGSGGGVGGVGGHHLQQQMYCSNHNLSSRAYHSSYHKHNHHQSLHPQHLLERTGSHVKVQAEVHNVHQQDHQQQQQLQQQQQHRQSDYQSFRGLQKSGDSLSNGVIDSQQQQQQLKILRSKSDMYLTGRPADNESDSEEEDSNAEEEQEEEVEDNDEINESTSSVTVRANNNYNNNNNNDNHQCSEPSHHEITVPNVDRETVNSNNNNNNSSSSTVGDHYHHQQQQRQPVYGIDDIANSDCPIVDNKPKQPLTIRTSTDTINDGHTISELNSATSSLEMTAHNSGNCQQLPSDPEMISADINLSADLMKALRCNGSVANNHTGEHSDSPFNDSGYRTKFSPSPREQQLQQQTTVHGSPIQHVVPYQHRHVNQQHPHQQPMTSYQSIAYHQSSVHQQQQQQQQQQYGRVQAYDPPIGLPTQHIPVPHVRRLTTTSTNQLAFNNNNNSNGGTANGYNQRSYSGPNSSLV